MENRKMKTSRKRQIIVISILVIVIFGVILYKSPRTFEKIISLEEQKSINNMYVSGNLPNGNNYIEVSNDRISEILKTFDDYKYKRCIDGPVSGNGVFLHLLTNTTRWSIYIEVWDSGYIRIPNKQIYKVSNVDNKELFEKVTNLLK